MGLYRPGAQPKGRDLLDAGRMVGDQTTETLHAARREVAAWTVRLVGRSRRIASSRARLELSRTGRAAYDHLAAGLADRGAL